jgi:hypothetical protein
MLEFARSGQRILGDWNPYSVVDKFYIVVNLFQPFFFLGLRLTVCKIEHMRKGI